MRSNNHAIIRTSSACSLKRTAAFSSVTFSRRCQPIHQLRRFLPLILVMTEPEILVRTATIGDLDFVS